MSHVEAVGENLLYLERKFDDPDPNMIKIIGAAGIVAHLDESNFINLFDFRNAGLVTEVSIDAVAEGQCPASPYTELRFGRVLDEAARMGPRTIWLDHFRFGGEWERMPATIIGPHPECKHCRGLDRTQVMASLAGFARDRVPDEIRIGYFNIPILPGESPAVTEIFGQDVQTLGKVLDATSPMLYHQMLGKPFGYIHQYLEWLKTVVDSDIVPALQVKSMPDQLKDTLTPGEMRAAYLAAKMAVSNVIWFSWDAAAKEQKVQDLARIIK